MPRSLQTQTYGTIRIGDPVERSTGLSDKPQHFVIYALLAFLPAVGFRKKAVRFAAGAAMVLFGIVLEYLQLLTQDRMFEVAGMLSNACGVAAGLLAAAVFVGRIANSGRESILRPACSIDLE
jgi:VanZ family protein